MSRKSSESSKYSKKQLRLELLTLIRQQGLLLNTDGNIDSTEYRKEEIRKIHSYSRIEKNKREREFIDRWLPKINKYFASGSEVNPKAIDPEPVLVENNEEYSALFRIASLWWSVPVSLGFGRRFRVLVFDRSNGKLFGLLSLTDPVFNLKTRDSWIGWDVRARERNLAHVLDANVLGSIPPYNQLLGAKFMGLLAASDFIRETFKRRYRGKTSVISGREFDGRLALVTATSALGKSSIYNRLRFDDIDVFQQVGFTTGYGHFHLANGTYEKLRHYLEAIGNPVTKKCKFGSGPNYRFRVVRTALECVGLSPDLLRHGVKRGVHMAPMAMNTAAFLRGETCRLSWYHRPLSSIVDFWRERWMLPRSQRDNSFEHFDKGVWKQFLS